MRQKQTKMEERVHRVSAKVNRGITPEQKKW